MASANFTNLPRALAKADIDFDTNTFKVLLVSSLPSEANLDSWANRSDVTGEVTGTGYTAGGIAQAFTLDAVDTSNNRQSVTYTNITNGWTSASVSAVGAIIYKNSGSAATDTLLHLVDFGGTVTCTAGNFSITYSAPFYINR
jgi:hypothetical protein